jgi:hypothetical protein
MPQAHRAKIAEGMRRARETRLRLGLPRGHGLSREALAELTAWTDEGYTSGWSSTQRAQALELLRLIDAQRRLTITDAALMLRMARQIHTEREDLGLLRDSPTAEHRRREAQAEQRQRDYLQTPAYAAMTDAELRRQGFPEHVIAERQAPVPELAA